MLTIYDYDAYILWKSNTITAAHNISTQLAFKNCSLFTKCQNNFWKNNRWCWRFRFSHGNVQFDRI